MNIRARVVHQTAGRVRLQLPQCRGDKDYFERLSQQLSGVRQVRTVRVNPLTGSVVIEYDGALDEVIASLQAAVPIELERLPARTEAQRPSPFAAAERTFRIVSGRDINPMWMAGVLFGAVGVVQSVRGKVLIPALTAFWYSVNAFSQAREPGLADGADSGRIVQ